MPETLPTKIASQLAWAPVDAWASAAANATDLLPKRYRGVARHWTLPRISRSSPVWRRFARNRPGHTTSREVRAWPIARLLDYSAPSATVAVPTLVLPPQAGHASSIVDYGRDQSQMMTLRDGGLDNLFAMDWQPATAETASLLDLGLCRGVS